MLSTRRSAAPHEPVEERRRRRWRGGALAVSLVAGLTPALLAENVSAGKQDTPSKVTALRCGRLLDVRTGGMKEGAIVVVRGDTIESIAARGAKVPDGATLVDLSAFT